MDEEDVMLLSVPPSAAPSVYTLPCESAHDTLGPNGSINSYLVDEDEHDFKSCTLPGKSRDVLGDKKALRKLVIACCLCFSFMCAEVVGGTIAKSLAVMTDAAHLFTDFIGFLISLSALLLARRSPTKKMTYGWIRAEILGVLFSVELIWLVTGVLVYFAVERVRNGNFEVHATPMLITAAFGVFVNLLMGVVLHQHVPHAGHSHHSAGHSSGHSHANLNVRAAFIHCLGDLIQSLGVLTAALIIYFKPEYKLADPICTFIFSTLVIGTTLFIFRDTVIVLMERAPRHIDVELIKEKLRSIDGVLECHNFHVWSLSTGAHVCSIHVTTNPHIISHETAVQRSYEVLHSAGDFQSITIQIEKLSLLPDV